MSLMVAVGVALVVAVCFVSPSLAACDPAAVTVAVDIGHSPTAPGATSARGRSEYVFNQDLARRVMTHLDALGFVGVLVETEHGGAPDLWARSRIAAARGADGVLSSHHDSVQPQFLERGTLDGRPARFSRYAEGYSLFVSRKNRHYTASVVVARAIGEAFADWGLKPTLHHAEPIRGENRPLLDANLGLYDFADLIVLKTATMPAVLIEAGVIVHPEEEVRLRDAFHQDLIAEAIARGLADACPSLATGP